MPGEERSACVKCVGSASCAGDPCGHDCVQGEREGEVGRSLRDEGGRAFLEDACERYL